MNLVATWFILVGAALLAGCATRPVVSDGPGRLSPSDRAKRSVALGDMNNITIALKLFRLDAKRFPTEREGLRALLRDPGVPRWRGPYLTEELLEDPWGTLYRYAVSGRDSTLSSAGPDKRFGTQDDVERQ